MKTILIGAVIIITISCTNATTPTVDNNIKKNDLPKNDTTMLFNDSLNALDQKVNASDTTDTIKINTTKAKKAKAVILATFVAYGPCEKYCFDTFNVVKVLQNKTDYVFPAKITIAYYEGEKQMPNNKECILYLSPYPLGSTKLGIDKQWMFLDANCSIGIEYK